MSRIRTVKPTFWTSGQVVECSPITRLLFIGLWNFCDRSGRRSFSPKQIKGQVFPSDNFTVEEITEMLWELSGNGLILIYDNGNNHLLEVTGWKHQKIDNETSSKLPGAFDEGSAIVRRVFVEDSTKVRRTIGDDSPKDLGLRNKDLGVGSRVNARTRARPSPPKKKSRLPEKAELTPSQAAAAEEIGLSGASRAVEWTKFLNYNLAKGNELADWDAAWRVWLTRMKHPPVAKPNGHAVPRIFVKEGTPQWNAWAKFWKKQNGVLPPKTGAEGMQDRGWSFPTEWPPTTPSNS